MRTTRPLLFSLCLALFFALSAPRLRADEWNQATKVVFNQSIEIPGKILNAGTYWFTLMNDDSDRNVVQVWNADQTQLLATILTVPDYRLQAKGRTVMKFAERPSTEPQALKAWFYPGDYYGHEFVYPESRARELAKRTGQPVLSMQDVVASNITKPAKSAKEPSVVAMKQAKVQAVEPNGRQTNMASVVQTKPENPKR